MDAWIFEAGNREVRFLVQFFAGNEAAATKISWRTGVKQGAAVQPGDELATLTWSSGSTEVLTAPDGCTGTIGKVNRTIRYEGLDKYPSEWALWLTGAGGA